MLRLVRKGKMSPKFELYMNDDQKNEYLILVANRKSFTMLSYYYISLNQKVKERSSENCLGKMRCLCDKKDFYVLYDNGESFKSKKL